MHKLRLIRTLHRAAVVQRKSKGIWKTLRSFGRLVTSRRRITDIRDLIYLQNLADLIDAKPEILLKWSGKYLAKSIDGSQRTRILAFHHRFIGGRVNRTFYARLLSEGFALWGIETASTKVRVNLRYPKSAREGDLSLVMTVDGVDVYELSFTIIPGDLVLASGPALLVARLQGRRNKFEAIKKATKQCSDVAPPYVLLAALEGVALALGVERVAGLSNASQVSGRKTFDYESLWATLTFQRTSEAFFTVDVPMPARPLEECSPEHRRRTKKKRAFRTGISFAARHAFEMQCLMWSDRHYDAAEPVEAEHILAAVG